MKPKGKSLGAAAARTSQETGISAPRPFNTNTGVAEEPHYFKRALSEAEAELLSVLDNEDGCYHARNRVLALRARAAEGRAHE